MLYWHTIQFYLTYKWRTEDEKKKIKLKNDCRLNSNSITLEFESDRWISYVIFCDNIPSRKSFAWVLSQFFRPKWNFIHSSSDHEFHAFSSRDR